MPDPVHVDLLRFCNPALCVGATMGRNLKAVLNVGARLMLDAVEVSSRGNLECTPFCDATNACRKKMKVAVGVIGFRVTDFFVMCCRALETLRVNYWSKFLI
ncbi:hypothetical protein [Burkholderia ubonensis]|uniref:hypothetical protein n=1 Tax=Burkholderia ubonensis TaxID=101571 RepID=UPI0011786CB8|nr:hypothetical protein [Burkholderia ubonensis]